MVFASSFQTVLVLLNIVFELLIFSEQALIVLLKSCDCSLDLYFVLLGHCILQLHKPSSELFILILFGFEGVLELAVSVQLQLQVLIQLLYLVAHS